MSKFLEYLKLIPKGIANADKVVEGIVNEVKMNYGNLSEDKQEEISRRRVICAGCPFMSKNAITSEEFLELTGVHYETKREEDHCTFCSCPILTKTASLSSDCGIAKYNETRENKLDLKWKQYDKTADLIRFFGALISTPNVSEEIIKKCNTHLLGLLNSMDAEVSKFTASKAGIIVK